MVEAKIRRLTRVVGAAAVGGAVAGVMLLLSVPSGLLGHLGFLTGPTVVSVAVLIWIGLRQLIAPKAVRGRDVVLVAGLVALTTGAIGFGEVPSATMCFDVNREMPDLAACLESLGTTESMALVTMLVSSVVLLFAFTGAALSTVARQNRLVSTTPALGSELEKLARLHGDGSLTDDEFAAAKRRLLSNP